ncbi:MAG: hypothetical protein ACJ704_04785 [Nitrososphaeraceae archaeon]
MAYSRIGNDKEEKEPKTKKIPRIRISSRKDFPITRRQRIAYETIKKVIAA